MTQRKWQQAVSPPSGLHRRDREQGESVSAPTTPSRAGTTTHRTLGKRMGHRHACQLQLCPRLQPPPCSRLRFTFPLHEVLQKAVPGAWIRVHLGHVVEVIIRDGHVLCISGNVDHLQRQTVPGSGSSFCFPVTLHRTQRGAVPCSTWELSAFLWGMAEKKIGLEADLLRYGRGTIDLILHL